MAVTVAAASAFALVFWLRSGLGDSPLAVLSILLNSLFPIWLTALVSSVFTGADTARRILLSAALTISLAFPALGIVLGPYVSAITAIALTAAGIVVCVRSDTVRPAAVFRALIGAVPLSLLLVVSGAPARLFLPEAMTLGVAHTDSLFHMALAQMIGRHFVPSTGADGLLFEHYHFASHAVAAGFAQASGASLAFVYAYWGALSLKIQLLWAVFLAGLVLGADSSKQASIRSLPRILYAMLILIASSSLESESFLFGLTIYLGLVPVLCSLIEAETEPRSFRIGLALALITSGLCAAAKVSVGFYCAVALVWIAYRHRRSPTTVGVTFLWLIALAIVTVRFLNPTDLSLTSAGLVIVVMSYVEYVNWTTLLSYTLPMLVLGIAITRPRFSRTWVPEGASLRLSILRQALRPKLRSWSAAWQTLVELEPSAQLLGISFAACAVVLLVMPIGSNMTYFSVVLLVAAGAMLPGTLSRVSNIEIDKSPVNGWLWALACCAGLACAQQFATAGTHIISTLFKAASNAQGPVAANNRTGGAAAREIGTSIRTTGTAFGLLRRQIDTLPWTALVRDLRERSAVSGGMVVHVLPSAEDFWRRLAAGSPYWCMAAQLMIPAETGIVEIRSIGPKAIEGECAPKGLLWYGFGRNQDLHRTGNLSVEQLCDGARLAHSKRIYMLSSISQPGMNKVVECGSH